MKQPVDALAGRRQDEPSGGAADGRRAKGARLGTRRRGAAIAIGAAVLVIGACSSGADTKVLGKQLERPTAQEGASSSVVPRATATGDAAPEVEVTPAVPRPNAAPGAPFAPPAGPDGKADVAKSPAPGTRVVVNGPESGPTYGPMTFEVRVTGRGGIVSSVTLDFGDGMSRSEPPPPGAAVSEMCDRNAATDATIQFRHGYRNPGDYRVAVKSINYRDCGSTPVSDVARAVKVSPGERHSNGPDTPVATDCILNYDSVCVHAQGRHAQAFGTARDPDGFVSRLVYEWGDGTADATPFALSECSDPGSTRPSSPSRNVDKGHDYSSPGTYHVTVTIESVGCDGQDVQTKRYVRDVSVG